VWKKAGAGSFTESICGNEDGKEERAQEKRKERKEKEMAFASG